MRVAADPVPLGSRGPGRDVEAIRALNAQYALRNDSREAEAWAEVFLPDGVFVTPEGDEIAGRDALAAHVREYTAVLGGARIRHAITNVLVAVAGDEARGTAYLAFFVTREGVTTLSAVGVYHDEYRRVDGQWLFARRRIVLDR